MTENKLYIGCHVGMGSPDYYLGTVKEALSYGANTFMFYTGSPQSSFRKPTNELFIKEAQAYIEKNNLDSSKIVVHAPYIINIANPNPESFSFAVNQLIIELKRVSDFGLSILVLHPGAHVGSGVEAGLNRIIEGLNLAFEADHGNVKIALETMAGKGTELGASFEQLAYIISNVKHKERLGVCLDTCHIFDDGLVLAKNYDAVLDDFDQIIGLDKLLCVHVNDSKNISGSHKDRHENIGYGEIGFEALNELVHNKRLVGIPMLLETPYFNEKPPYKQEIKMLREGNFVNNWRNNL